MSIRKCLLILSGLITGPFVFASCELKLSSLVDVESGSLSLVAFDDIYNSMKTRAIPLAVLKLNTVSFPFYGKSLDCSTRIYQKSPLFNLSLTPFCDKTITSADISGLKEGEYYTRKCSDNLSVDIIKTNDDSLLSISIVPAGFHAISVRSFIAGKAESSSIALKVTNLQAPKSAGMGDFTATFKDGFYHFANDHGGTQSLLYSNQKHEKSHIDVFLSENNKYDKIGECSVFMNQNKLNIKCQTITNPGNYKIVPQYNTIYIIDPTSNN